MKEVWVSGRLFSETKELNSILTHFGGNLPFKLPLLNREKKLKNKQPKSIVRKFGNSQYNSKLYRTKTPITFSK